MDPSDIVEQLRSVDGTKDAGFVIDLCWEAAAEIERLRAALAEQNEACARVAEKYGCGNPDCDECHGNIIAAAIRARGR